MIEAIKKIEDHDSKTDAEVHVILAAETREVRDDTPITVGEIVDALDDSDALLVLGTIKQEATRDPRVDSSWIALSTVGMRLDTAERQGMIDLLAAAGNWPNSVRDTVKELRVRDESVWPDITVADVTAARQAEQTRITIEQAEQAYRDVHSQFLVPVLDGESELTIANLVLAFRDAADALEAL